jgi:phosphatidylinositol kinase/protein kinase (PI-3  family)
LESSEVPFRLTPNLVTVLTPSSRLTYVPIYDTYIHTQGYLESSEEVPFRLTPNLVAVLTPFLIDGVMMTTMTAGR